MKRTITFIIAAIMLAISLPASATSYGGYVRNWWVEPSGDINFYFWDSTNTNPVNGPCGSNNYRLRTTNANFDEAYASFLLAAKNSYKVWMEVSSCAATINLIDQALICTIAAGC